MIALTIGVFDGVHRGHQLLLNDLSKTGYKTVVLTFSNHPLSVLKGISPPLLTPLPLKTALLKQYGADEVIVIPFTKTIAEMSFEEFLKPYSIRHLILGEDAAFGQGRRGTPEALHQFGQNHGFTVHVQPLLQIDNQPLSSTRIRALVAKGLFEEAETLLGRPYCLSLPCEKPALPPDGQYRVWSHSYNGIQETTLSIHNQTIMSLSNHLQLITFMPKHSTQRT